MHSIGVEVNGKMSVILLITPSAVFQSESQRLLNLNFIQLLSTLLSRLEIIRP